MAGKKSASWQPVAVVEGSKKTQKGKKQLKIVKISAKSKEKFACVIFWLP